MNYTVAVITAFVFFLSAILIFICYYIIVFSFKGVEFFDIMGFRLHSELFNLRKKTIVHKIMRISVFFLFGSLILLLFLS